MMRLLIVALLLFSCLGVALAEPAGVTERDYAHYRALQKAGLADLPMDMNRLDLTHYELAWKVGDAIERVKAHAWNDSATSEQKVEALQALQQLITECKADLQRLGVSVKNAVARINKELRELRPDATAPKGTKVAEPPPSARRETANARVSDLNKARAKVASLASLDLAPMTPNAARAAQPLNSVPTRALTLDLSGSPTSALAHTDVRLPIGRALEVTTAVAQGRALGLPDAHAAKLAATFSPGPFTLVGAVSNTSRSAVVNAMAGVSPQMMPNTTAFGGDVMVRGPLGLRVGGGIEGVRTPDTDTLGRYSTMVGFERMGEKLSLSLDLKRSVFFYDPNMATYSYRFGLGYNVSRNVGLQMRYYQDDFRALGLREGGFQNFIAGQVSVRW